MLDVRQLLSELAMQSNSVHNNDELDFQLLCPDMKSTHNSLQHVIDFQFHIQISYTPMNLAPYQRSHGLRFEPRTVANRAVFKAQGHAD